MIAILCSHCAWTGAEPYFPFISHELPSQIATLWFSETMKGRAYCPECGWEIAGVFHISEVESQKARRLRIIEDARNFPNSLAETILERGLSRSNMDVIHYQQERFCDGLATRSINLMFDALNAMSTILSGYSLSVSSYSEIVRFQISRALEDLDEMNFGYIFFTIPTTSYDRIEIHLYTVADRYETQMKLRTGGDTSFVHDRWKDAGFTESCLAVPFDSRKTPFIVPTSL